MQGCASVLMFRHSNPSAGFDLEGESPQTQPAAAMHVDQTFKGAINRVHRHLPVANVPKLVEKRFQIINLWRPISHAAYDWPLALCDHMSVDPNDLIPVALVVSACGTVPPGRYSSSKPPSIPITRERHFQSYTTPTTAGSMLEA
jgi:hypothetical protein